MKSILALFFQILLFSSFCGGQSPAPPLQVRILSPTNGTVLRAHEQSVTQVEVTALDGLVSKVDFFADTNSFGHLTEPPCTFPFQADVLGPGLHHLSVTAADNRGNQATSPIIEITVLAFAPVVRAVYLIPSDRTLNPAYVNAIF